MPNINSLIKGLRSTQEYFDTISYANIAMIDLDVQVQFKKKFQYTLTKRTSTFLVLYVQSF